MSRGLAYDSDEGRNFAAALTAIMHGEAYRQSSVVARDHGGPFLEYDENRAPFLRVIRKHRDAAYSSPAGRAAGRPRRRPGGVRRGPRARRGARLPERPGDRAGPHRDHRVHDGLRYHRRRAGHRPHQVQEARRRGLPQDRQPDGPGRPAQARLPADRGRGDPRPHQRAGDDRGRTGPEAGAPVGLRLRVQAGQRRAVDPLHGPRPDDGRDPAVHLRRDQQDRQHAGGGHGRGDRVGLPRGLEAGPEGDRDLPRRQEAQPAAQHRQEEGRGRGAEAARGHRRRSRSSSPRPRSRRASRTAAGSRPSGPRSPTSSTSPATRATSPSGSTRTASPARSS